MAMWEDFKKFAVKGNVLDLAVGVIIGSAFGNIVTSLVNDIIMPIMGILLGKIDFSGLSLKVGGASVNFGMFINNVVNFAIISVSIFLVIRRINRLTGRDKREVTPPETKKCRYCCSEIDAKAVRCPHCTSMLEETEY